MVELIQGDKEKSFKYHKVTLKDKIVIIVKTFTGEGPATPMTPAPSYSVSLSS